MSKTKNIQRKLSASRRMYLIVLFGASMPFIITIGFGNDLNFKELRYLGGIYSLRLIVPILIGLFLSRSIRQGMFFGAAEATYRFELIILGITAVAAIVNSTHPYSWDLIVLILVVQGFILVSIFAQVVGMAIGAKEGYKVHKA